MTRGIYSICFLVSLSIATRRERRRVQARHLWDQVSLDWHVLNRKLYVSKHTGLSREETLAAAFCSQTSGESMARAGIKRTQLRDAWAAWESAQYDIGIYKVNLPPFSIDVDAAIRGFGIENEAALQVLRSSKDQHACRWQAKEGTYRVKRQSLPDVRDTGGDVLMGDL